MKSLQTPKETHISVFLVSIKDLDHFLSSTANTYTPMVSVCAISDLDIFPSDQIMRLQNPFSGYTLPGTENLKLVSNTDFNLTNVVQSLFDIMLLLCLSYRPYD